MGMGAEGAGVAASLAGCFGVSTSAGTGILVLVLSLDVYLCYGAEEGCKKVLLLFEIAEKFPTKIDSMLIFF